MNKKKNLKAILAGLELTTDLAAVRKNNNIGVKAQRILFK